MIIPIRGLPMSQQENKYTKKVDHSFTQSGVYIPAGTIDHSMRTPAYYPTDIVFVSERKIPGQHKPKNEDGEFSMKKIITTYLPFLGLALTMLIAFGGFAWKVSDKINESNNELRKELQSTISANRQEMTVLINSIDSRNNDRFNRSDIKFDRIESRIDKVESKIDDNFKETNKNISDIKELIIKSK